MLTYSLSIHADYRCRHSGACCRAGWPIPIDPPLRQALDTARANGRLVLPVRDERADPHVCEFFDASAGTGANAPGGCTIHRQLGIEYKPPSCRHFPRVALLDARGVSITLSHFCPTAAALLFRDHVPLRVVRNAPAFPPEDEYEGLDARDVLPPLLRPGMLWDFEGYAAWEDEAVRLFDRDRLTPERALALLRSIAADVERWNAADGGLAPHVRHAFADAARASDAGQTASPWGDSARVVNRYLAARLFASRVPYKSDRLQALVDDLESAHAILADEAARAPLADAVRAADLRIVHRSPQASRTSEPLGAPAEGDNRPLREEGC